jgi:hypothetical protein
MELDRPARPALRAFCCLALLLVQAGCQYHATEPRPAAAQPPQHEQAPPDVLAAWVELGPDGPVARVITTAATCPGVTLDGTSRPMQVRARPDPPRFTDLVCELSIPHGTKAADLAGRVLALPRPNPRRIVVIGDTGCRLRGKDVPQSCDDPHAWSFATLAATVAKSPPDLVVHVGDYLYREEACPSGDAGCAGSPWGDDTPAWQADFFTPAQSLLAAAPWVVTRGNHERCSRGGDGWFRYLEPRPSGAGCARYTPPYAVDLGDLRLLAFDSSSASDRRAEPEQLAALRPQFAALADLASGETWFVTHRPIWGVGHKGFGLLEDGDDPGPEPPGPPEELFVTNPTLQAASRNALPAAVKLVLSGHIHLFELVSFAQRRAPQIVVGDSGTELDPLVVKDLRGQRIAGIPVAHAKAVKRFGYLTIERNVAGQSATLRGVGGELLLSCTQRGLAASCGD